ncbi:MAG TPA: 4Fe-4S binding protein [Thermodesulfobacteriota bacterium]|nr:4Fe-4S binding protein [Thermodesulfobacteriota bacterium]
MKDHLLDLPVKIGGVEFKNPFMVASGPTVKRVDQLEQAEREGWAAASIKQTFNPIPYLNYEPRYRWLKKEKLHTFTAEYRLNMEEGLRLVEEGRKKCKELVVIANYSYVKGDLEGWQDAARRFEAAGAQMLEINFCCPNMSFNVDVSSPETKESRPSSGASMGQDENSVRLVIQKTREVTGLPIIAKITPEGGRIAEVSRAAFNEGAAAVSSVANRLGIPPIDIWNYRKPIYHLQGQNTMGCLSGPWIKPLALRDVFEIRSRVGSGPVIVGTGGVASMEDAVEMMMCGADVIGICTETMLSGFGFLRKWMTSLKAYMEKMGFRTCRDIRDLLLREIKPATDLTIWAGYAQVDPDKCSGCGLCVEIGHCNAIILTDETASVDSKFCHGCSTCMDICPKGAIRMVETR